MKALRDRIYVDNPGLECSLEIQPNSIININTFLKIKNNTNANIIVNRNNLPNSVLLDECLSIEHIEKDINLVYKGNILPRNFQSKKEDLISIEPLQKVNFTCQINSYFDFERNKSYKILFNTWMPLIDISGIHVRLLYGKDNTILPAYFLLESEWTYFKIK